MREVNHYRNRREHSMRTRMKAATAAAVMAAAAVSSAVPAWAHVEVSGIDASQGGYGVLTFRVPTESDTATTTDLLVTLPDDDPILSVSTQPKAGWTAHITKKKLATPQKDDDGNDVTDYVSSVEWKADNPQAAIPSNQFDTFSISAGPLPKTESLSIPAVQTYSDGKIVNWNEKAAQGQPEPEHPAPVVKLTAGGDTDSPAAVTPPPPASSTTPAAAPAAAPTWPGIAGLVVAVIAVLLGLANLALLRRKS
ncbi:YcnI family protein [Mycolicibacterium sp. Y3]